MAENQNNQPYDVAIIGSGFAGSILARMLRRRELRVLLLERGTHPRFALGESTTPLANLSLERIARRYSLEDLHQLATYGRWQRHFPQLRRGLKRGFTFFQHQPGEQYRHTPNNNHRLLVAASPNDRLADTHWLRQDIDHHLVKKAALEGVDVLQEATVCEVDFSPEGARIQALHRGTEQTFKARWVVDGSGPNGVLKHALNLTEQPVAINTGLLYGHFEQLPHFVRPANHTKPAWTQGPYPDDQAAVHHLLDGAWLYALPFDHGVTSAGLVLRNPGAKDSATFKNPHSAWETSLAPYPSLAEQFRHARPQSPIRYIERLQYRLDRAAGPGWVLLPHTFAFFDPMFSTGIAWSLIAIERIADMLTAPEENSWQAYDHLLNQEADQIERLIEAAYGAMHNFHLFTHVCFLYFATVSFQEVGQRVLSTSEQAAAWAGFLGAGDAHLRNAFLKAAQFFRPSEGPNPIDPKNFTSWVLETIRPYNIAGLGEAQIPNLYPLDLDLLIDRAELLGLSRQEMEAALPKLRGDQE